MKNLIICMLVFTACLTTNGQGVDWYRQVKQIRILQTNQKEIEMIFQKPKETFRSSPTKDAVIEIVHYENDDFTFSTYFALDKCFQEDDKKNSIAIPNGSLIHIAFFLKNPVKFSTLKLNRKEMGRAKKGDPGMHYLGLDGIDYAATRNNRITQISIEPDLEKTKIICNGINLYAERDY